MPGSEKSGRPSETSQIKLHGSDELPTKPDDLGSYGSELWDEAIAALPHVLRRIDFAILVLACKTFELSQCAEDEKTRLSATRLFSNLSDKLGLNPHCRRIIKPIADEVVVDDAFKQWLRKGGLN